MSPNCINMVKMNWQLSHRPISLPGRLNMRAAVVVVLVVISGLLVSCLDAKPRTTGVGFGSALGYQSNRSVKKIKSKQKVSGSSYLDAWLKQFEKDIGKRPFLTNKDLDEEFVKAVEIAGDPSDIRIGFGSALGYQSNNNLQKESKKKQKSSSYIDEWRKQFEKDFGKRNYLI